MQHSQQIHYNVSQSLGKNMQDLAPFRTQPFLKSTLEHCSDACVILGLTGNLPGSLCWKWKQEQYWEGHIVNILTFLCPDHANEVL